MILPFLRHNYRILSLMGLLCCTSLFGGTVLTTLAITWRGTLATLSDAQWAGLFAISTMTMAVALTPSTLIAMITGYFLGWGAFCYIAISYPIASALGFMVGKRLDRGKLMNSLPPSSRLQQVLDGLSGHQWPLVMLTRLSPILPFSLMNLVLPAIGVRLPVFLLAGSVGMLPRTLFAMWAGMQGRDLMALLRHPAEGNLSLIFMLVATTLSIGGLVYLVQKVSAGLLEKRLGLADRGNKQ